MTLLHSTGTKEVKYEIANSILLGVVADRVLSPTNALAEARKFVALF